MIDVIEFVEDIQAEVPEALEITVVRLVRQAATEFAERTGVWQVCIPIPMSEKSEYEIPLPEGADIIAPARAEFSLGSSRHTVLPTLPSLLPPAQTGFPVEYSITENTLKLSPNPSDGVLTLWLKLKPSRKAMSFPSGVFDRWFYHVRAGAIAKLLNMVGQPWYAPDASVSYLRMFEDGVLEAGREARRVKSKLRNVVRYGGL